MRPSRTLPALLLLLAMLGCDATPTDPTSEVDGLMAPSAAVLSEATAFPFWKRGPLLTSDQDYFIVYFYVADPDVIPDDHNMLQFFDPRALGAEFAVRGLEVRESAGDPVPKKVHLSATAPIEFWFVPADVLRDAAADGFLGADELLATGEVIVGHTTHFGEELHPSGGTAKQVLLHAQARGTLDEGGRFRVTISIHTNPESGDRSGVVRLALDRD